MGNALTGARTTGGTGSAAGGERALAPGTPAAAAAAARRRRWRRRARTQRAGSADHEAAVRPDLRDRSGKGEMFWQVAHGETPDSIRNHAALKGMNIPRTGRPGVVGSLTTKTLVISGEAGFGPTPTGARGRCCARTTRRRERKWARSIAGAADRLADDLHAERPAVPRGRRQRRGIPGS